MTPAFLLQAIGPNDSVRFDGLTPSVHNITFGNVTPNCTTTLSSPISVNVTADSIIRQAEGLTCPRANGTSDMIIHTATTGTGLDSTLFISVDSGAAQPIGPNDSILIPNVVAGPHVVVLDSVDVDCTVAGAQSLPLTATALAAGDAKFDPTCTVPAPRIGKPTAMRVRPVPSTGRLASSAGAVDVTRRRGTSDRRTTR
ncbi:MAG: hypothetical protein ABJD11_15865 [Gemmatimonadota bacterium]